MGDNSVLCIRFSQLDDAGYQEIGSSDVDMPTSSSSNDTSIVVSSASAHDAGDRPHQPAEAEEDHDAVDRHPISNLESLMHLFKGNIGSGFLAIPDGFKSAGLVFGTVGMVFIAVICVRCMHTLIRCSNLMCERTKSHYLDYASTAEQVFATGPEKVRKFSTSVRYVTNFYLCVTQLGFCSVYFIFVSNNVKLMVDKHYPDYAYLDYRIYASLLLVPMILLCMTKSLKFLAPASTVANVFLTISICIIFYYLCRHFQPVASRKAFASVSTLPQWFGTVVYSFEGIGLVLPIKNNMKSPKAFDGLTGILNTGMSIVSLLYIAMGFYGYLQYGDDVLGSITLNLPQEPLADSVRVMVVIVIFLSYPIQFYVPILIMWPILEKKLNNKRWQLHAQRAFKILMITITFAFAVIIPQLGLFISLIGAFAGSYLSLILPPILDIVTVWSQRRPSLYVLSLNAFIFLFGFLGLVTGTYVSLDQIIKTFKS